MSWTRCPMCKDTSTVGIFMAMTYDPHESQVKEIVNSLLLFIARPSEENQKNVALQCDLLRTAPMSDFEKEIHQYNEERKKKEVK